ncbi:hypothetical protein E2C01_081213 [Portunus trituberculatus]|uniref:Uncharacterized protein n=1 Tax=Portunus trituberculatus TaxID=210409 RepID=A0A5B7J0H6_PORTR|nr:hypothetical protein [Portunus trituberculatus]
MQPPPGRPPHRQERGGGALLRASSFEGWVHSGRRGDTHGIYEVPRGVSGSRAESHTRALHSDRDSLRLLAQTLTYTHIQTDIHTQELHAGPGVPSTAIHHIATAVNASATPFPRSTCHSWMGKDAPDYPKIVPERDTSRYREINGILHGFHAIDASLSSPDV